MRQDTFRRKTRRRFFRFFGILPLQKKSGSRRRANFSAQGGKGTQSGKPFAGAARFFSVGLCGLRFAEPPLRRANFFRTGRKRGAKRQAFCGRSPVFLRGALRITVRRAASAAADFSARGVKGRKAASLLRAQPGFSPWGFAGYGSPSRFCGGGFFRMGRKRGAPQSAERALALFQRE